MEGAGVFLASYDGLEQSIDDVVLDLIEDNNCLLQWDLYTLLDNVLKFPEGVNKRNISLFRDC